MKPRLKLDLCGHLHVVQPGVLPWAEASARKFVMEQYGSIAEFAERFGLSYHAVCIALRGRSAARMAGKVSTVRQLLGLPSHPSRRAVLVANSRGGRA